jgi:DNA invertase Pin-like site-specific DNA recombinase
MGTWAGYRRVSRVGDRDETLISPDLQAAEIERYAAGRNLTVEMLEPELDVSGGKAIRPILEEVIAGIEGGRYDGVIVADIDRLSRLSLLDALALIERVEGAGGQVISVAQNFDAATPEGRWGRNIWLSTTHMQLERYGANFRRAKASAVERGVWPFPKAPIGYTVHHRKHGGDGRLRIDPENAGRVRRAFELRAAGAPWSRVADELGGASTTAGKVIRNRAYLGEVVLGDWVNPAGHEAIVDRALWESAQLEHARPARGVHPPALLAGIVRCAACQRKMTPNTDRKGRIYRCMPRNAAGRCQAPAIIGQKKLDAYVTAAFLAHLGDGRHSAAQRTDDVDAAATSLADAEAELAAYQEATSVSDIGAEHFMTGMRSRVAAVNEARNALGHARASAQALPEGGDLQTLWHELDVEERRHVLRSSLSVVWVRKGRGPCEGRVRVVDASVAVDVPDAIVAVDWPEGDVVGEIRPARAEHV